MPKLSEGSEEAVQKHCIPRQSNLHRKLSTRIHWVARPACCKHPQ